MKTRTRRTLGSLGALTAGALAALFMNLGGVVDGAMTPGAAFDLTRAPLRRPTTATTRSGAPSPRATSNRP